MAKELPYFRFYPSEWLEGNITLENEKTQGFFVKLLCWYWKKDCEIDLKFINKRLVNGKATLKQCLNNLIDSKIIKVDENQRVIITFLDEQLDVLTEKRNKLVEAGRLGGKASVKQRSSYNNKDVLLKDYILKEEKEFNDVFEYRTYRYAKSLHDNFLKIHPNSIHLKEAKIFDWVKDARKLSKKTPEEVGDVFSFSQNDDFWKTTIVDIHSFVKHYDKLREKCIKN